MFCFCFILYFLLCAPYCIFCFWPVSNFAAVCLISFPVIEWHSGICLCPLTWQCKEYLKHVGVCTNIVMKWLLSICESGASNGVPKTHARFTNKSPTRETHSCNLFLKQRFRISRKLKSCALHCDFEHQLEFDPALRLGI